MHELHAQSDAQVGLGALLAGVRKYEKRFPNVAVRPASTWVGCPATSASMERLFSSVGIAYGAKRKRTDAETLESIAFARENLPKRA